MDLTNIIPNFTSTWKMVKRYLVNSYLTQDIQWQYIPIFRCGSIKTKYIYFIHSRTDLY